ncbi:hypothetical protein AgCh_027600 [Apium graveolens]
MLHLNNLHIPSEILVTLPPEELHAVNRVLVTMHQRLVTANTDKEVLLEKLKHEVAVKERLTAELIYPQVLMLHLVEGFKERRGMILRQEPKVGVGWLSDMFHMTG